MYSNKISSVCLTIAAVALLLSASVVYAGETTSAGSTCQLITITMDRAGGGSEITTSPKNVSVPLDSCTVWVNLIRDRKVNVSFRENAKKCVASTNPETGFNYFDLGVGQACYMSDTLPFGKSASLYWSQPGKFVYTIESPSLNTDTTAALDVSAKGSIEVKK